MTLNEVQQIFYVIYEASKFEIQNLNFWRQNFCVFFRNKGKQSNFGPEIFLRGFSMVLNLMVQKLSKSVQVSKSYENLRKIQAGLQIFCSNFSKSKPIWIILISFDDS